MSSRCAFWHETCPDDPIRTGHEDRGGGEEDVAHGTPCTPHPAHDRAPQNVHDARRTLRTADYTPDSGHWHSALYAPRTLRNTTRHALHFGAHTAYGDSAHTTHCALLAKGNGALRNFQWASLANWTRPCQWPVDIIGHTHPNLRSTQASRAQCTRHSIEQPVGMASGLRFTSTR